MNVITDGEAAEKMIGAQDGKRENEKKKKLKTTPKTGVGK